jgi:hypothetical protein
MAVHVDKLIANEYRFMFILWLWITIRVLRRPFNILPA